MVSCSFILSYSLQSKWLGINVRAMDHGMGHTVAALPLNYPWPPASNTMAILVPVG